MANSSKNWKYAVLVGKDIVAYADTLREADNEAKSFRGAKVYEVNYSKSEKQGQRKNPDWGEDPQYWRTILQEYGFSYWKENWWRECIQNSVDAGASTVKLYCSTNSDLSRTLICDDDGKGMNSEILVLSFFQLGGSGKRNENGGTTGGFGKAKELLLIPWTSWDIKTKNLHAWGRGKNTEIECLVCNSRMPGSKTSSPEALAWVESHKSCKSLRTGTILTVVMPPERYTYDGLAVNYLTKCYLPGVKFFVNDQQIKANLRSSGDPIRQSRSADLYFVKNRDKDANSFFVVRVRGQAMFSKMIDSNIHGVIICELTGPSTLLLSTSRNAFGDAYLEDFVTNYLRKLASDASSALKSKLGLIRETYKGLGTFKAETTIRKVQDTLNFGTVTKTIHSKPAEVVDNDSIQRIVDTVGAFEEINKQNFDPLDTSEFVGQSPNAAAKAILSGNNLTIVQAEAAIAQLLWKPDYILMNDIPNLKPGQKFRPAHMAKRLVTLLKVWAEFCRYVMIQVGAKEHFGVGFCLSDQMGACYLHREEAHWVIFNPLISYSGSDTELGNSNIYDPKSVDTLKKLYAAAVHEVSHFANGYVGYSPGDEDELGEHNENFSTALTNNIELTVAGWPRCLAIAKAIVEGADIETDKEFDLGPGESTKEQKARKKYGGDPSPTLTTVSTGDVFEFAYQPYGYDQVFKGRNIEVMSWADGYSVEKVLLDFIYSNQASPGTNLVFSLVGSDNVFVYKIGQRAELKGVPIYVGSTGTPKVQKERTYMPSPEKAILVSSDEWCRGFGHGSDISWREFNPVEYPGMSVQQFADSLVSNNYIDNLKIKTRFGVYRFTSGKRGKTQGKAILIRENPAY